MSGGECVQKFLNKIMNKTQTYSCYSKYSERYTSAINIHKIATNKTSSRYTNTFKYCTNQSLFLKKTFFSESQDVFNNYWKCIFSRKEITCNVAAVPLGATIFA